MSSSKRMICVCACVPVKVQKSDHPHSWDPCVNYCHPSNSTLTSSSTLNKSWTASNNNTINSLDYCKCKNTTTCHAVSCNEILLYCSSGRVKSLFAALVSASFSPSSTTTSGPSSQSSSTLPRPIVPMSPRNSLLKRRQRKKEHKSSCRFHYFICKSNFFFKQ